MLIERSLPIVRYGTEKSPLEVLNVKRACKVVGWVKLAG
jgi:hypothetical protein